MLFTLTVPVFATESGTATEITEAISETTIEISDEDAEDIIGIIENSESRGDAILAVAEKIGISAEEAEGIIDTFIALGDKYFGESSTWAKFKNSLQEDKQFWISVFVAGAAVIAIIAFGFILLAKTNPTMRKAMFGMEESVKINKAIAQANSQTLENIEKNFNEMSQKMLEMSGQLLEKKETIIALQEELKVLKQAQEKMSRRMLKAEMYDLQAHKLTLARSNLPMTDKSALDLWFARAEESLKEELGGEDVGQLGELIDKGENNG
jgi:DNA replicative helicase MCM subunit Mcm2 (Cdc46/Mcm family)